MYVIAIVLIRPKVSAESMCKRNKNVRAFYPMSHSVSSRTKLII